MTPRGGRDDIDGIEKLADGRSRVKVRVRAIAEGGEANRGGAWSCWRKRSACPRPAVKLLSGATSRLKQVAVDGDPRNGLAKPCGELDCGKSETERIE